MESVRVNFDDTVGFGLTSNTIIPKIGDLIHKNVFRSYIAKNRF